MEKKQKIKQADKAQELLKIELRRTVAIYNAKFGAEAMRDVLAEIEADEISLDKIESMRDEVLAAWSKMPIEARAAMRVFQYLTPTGTEWGSSWTNDFDECITEADFKAALNDPAMRTFKQLWELASLYQDE